MAEIDNGTQRALPSASPPPSSLGAFIGAAHTLGRRLRGLCVRARAASLDPNNQLRDAARRLLAAALERLESSRDLIDACLTAVRKAVVADAAAAATPDAVATAELAAAAATYRLGRLPSAEAPPAGERIPAACRAWLTRLQAETANLEASAAFVGARAAGVDDEGEFELKLGGEGEADAGGAGGEEEDLIGPLPVGFEQDAELLAISIVSGTASAPSARADLPMPWPPPEPRFSQLRAAVLHARRCERSVAFQAELSAETQTILATSPNSRETDFAYGSTFLSSFLRLSSSPPMEKQLQRLHAAQQRGGEGTDACRDALVVGSSTGLLQFYLALSLPLPIRSVGVDVLPLMVFTARSIALAAGISHAPSATDDDAESPVRFECCDAADMRGDLMSRAGLVIVASLAWHDTLRRDVYARLLAHLPNESLLVDWVVCPLARDLSVPIVRASERLVEVRSFEGVGEPIAAAASWSATQNLYLSRVRVKVVCEQ